MVNYYKRSRLFRGLGLSCFLSALIELIVALILRFWQIGSCNSGCFWHDGLPWTTHNNEGNKIVVLVFGIIACIVIFIGLVLGLLEVYVSRLQLSDKFTFIIIGVGIVAILFILLHWILFLIFIWLSKLAILAFCFGLAIMGTITLILACIFYIVGVHYARKWRRKERK